MSKLRIRTGHAGEIDLTVGIGNHNFIEAPCIPMKWICLLPYDPGVVYQCSF